ncbi:hypothetical protein, partial [Klebsiella pneumoniae]|uniref:hypothetical protein n=1 Tax=Klebsiella pneumoniae TaxID=573 RepID=UPI003EBBDC28
KLQSQNPLQTKNKKIKPHLILKHKTPLTSQNIPEKKKPLIKLYLKPKIFSKQYTKKLPLHINFIHKIKFEKISKHQILIKKKPKNQNPTKYKTTHKTTS